MSTEPQNILLVCTGDDAETLSEILEGAGYRLTHADDLASAQPIARRLDAGSLVLIDDSAPGDLVGFLASMRQYARVPIVMLVTGDGSGPAGVTEVVAKPYDPPLLLEVVQRLLERG